MRVPGISRYVAWCHGSVYLLRRQDQTPKGAASLRSRARAWSCDGIVLHGTVASAAPNCDGLTPTSCVKLREQFGLLVRPRVFIATGHSLMVCDNIRGFTFARTMHTLARAEHRWRHVHRSPRAPVASRLAAAAHSSMMSHHASAEASSVSELVSQRTNLQ